ncbi:MAG: hypothetical protein WAS07_05060, partial [Micropruina sp.]
MALAPENVSASAESASDFGANDWLIDEMYDQYVDDPESVTEAWQQYFASHALPVQPTPQPSAGSTAPTPSPAAPTEVTRRPPVAATSPSAAGPASPS